MTPEQIIHETKIVHMQITASLMESLELAQKALNKISDAVIITNFEDSTDIKNFHGYLKSFNEGMSVIEKSIVEIGKAYRIEL